MSQPERAKPVEEMLTWRIPKARWDKLALRARSHPRGRVLK